jgi:hypothetical protein
MEDYFGSLFFGAALRLQVHLADRSRPLAKIVSKDLSSV